MQIPKVSVIMAVRNGEKTLPETIDSILKQTLRDFELIIVDDASEDKTPEILHNYYLQDDRIKIITNETRQERCISRNKAIEKSKAKYIAVIDADDISLPERLEKEYKYLEQNKEVFLVGARAYIVDEQDKKIGKSWADKEPIEVTDILKERNVLVHSSVMFRSEPVYKYREKFVFTQDYDIFLQMVKEGKRLDLLPDFLVIYRDSKDIEYDHYKTRQMYASELSRMLLRDEINYEDIDADNIEQYMPEELLLEIKLKKNFFDGNYKESRKYSKQLIKIDNSIWWKLFYIDSFLGGNIIKVGKYIKRKFLI